MNQNKWSWALAGTFVVALCALVALESYWRGRGFEPTHNDDKILWSTKRKEVYRSPSEGTVFIGGSRIKFDLDVSTWEKLTGEKAIQLAIVGTPPRLILRDLANDEKFKGKLIIDVAEAQFFSFSDSSRRDRLAREALEYHYDETPAQRMSASINHFLESKLVFLEEGKFSLNPLLNKLVDQNRPGVIGNPAVFTPLEFGVVNFGRQTQITPMFLADPKVQEQQKAFWMRGIKAAAPIKGDTLQAFLSQMKNAIDKIRSRGGEVVFVRPPSDGPYIEMERRLYPREKYWDYLLDYTNTPGIHFQDYPGTANLICAEWSHLSVEGAAAYTSQLVSILEKDMGWRFPNKINASTQLRTK
jgi:hypothetical protein